MKSTKFLLLIVLSSLIIPCVFITLSYANPALNTNSVGWQVNEGDKITWIVTNSNTSYGFMPVNSKYELTINSISSIPSMSGGDATELNGTLKSYHSELPVIITILDNETFVKFDSGNNHTSFYTYFIEHGFFIPPDYVDEFTEGVFDFFIPPFSGMGAYVSAEGKYIIDGITDDPAHLYVAWRFNANFITERLVVANTQNYEVEYQLELETFEEAAISIGYFFLAFTGLAIVSLIYIYKMKEK